MRHSDLGRERRQRRPRPDAGHDPGEPADAPADAALSRWLTDTLLQHALGGLAVGPALGWLSGRLRRWAYGRRFTEETSILTSAIGAVLPWRQWLELGWEGLAAVAVVLVLRRLPAWLLLRRWLDSVRDLRAARFNGWVGPIGVAALFYASELRHEVGNERIWLVASLVVFGSIVVHGISATPMIARFGGRPAASAQRAVDRS